MERWHAVATYRSDNGPVEVEHDFEELGDLADLIERGPNWNTITSIIVTLARLSETPTLTLEQAERLRGR